MAQAALDGPTHDQVWGASDGAFAWWWRELLVVVAACVLLAIGRRRWVLRRRG